jgi:CHAD domain-containing protein
MATFEGTLLDEPAPRGTRLVALALLDDLMRERDRLSGSAGVGGVDDRGALHDFRVALRRLRSWLRAVRPMTRDSQPKRAIRRLRRIAKESNAGRDAEVFLEWLTAAEPRLSARSRGAARWLIRMFESQRREADVSLQLILARDFGPAVDRLRGRLQSYHLAAHVFHGLQEPVLALTLAGLVREHAARLRRRLEDVRSADDERAAHRARIAGKRLRYLLEPMAPHVEGGGALIDSLKGLQDALGDLHDAHIWLMVLREVVADLAMEEGRRRARRTHTSGTPGERGE